MSVQVRAFLKARRDRALGAVMGHSERNFFDRLTREEQLAFRGVVVDALNTYHDTILDLFKGEDGLQNDEVVRLLHELNSRLPTTLRS